MPITLDTPISAARVVEQTQTIQATHLHPERTSTDASKHDGTVAVDYQFRPYCLIDESKPDEEGNRIYSSSLLRFFTKDAYAAIANYPTELAAIIPLLQQQENLWKQIVAIAGPLLSSLAAQIVAAQSALATATANEAAALTVRDAAFVARSSRTDSLWTNADAAWLATKAAAATARENVTKAQAAAQDPANPKL